MYQTDTSVILKPHLLIPLIGLALGQGLLDTVGSTVGSTLDNVGQTVDNVGQTLDNTGVSLDTGAALDTGVNVDSNGVNLDTGATLDTSAGVALDNTDPNLAVDPNLVNVDAGLNVDAGVGVLAADVPAGWKYNGCFNGFPKSDYWITYNPDGTGLITDEACTKSCRPFRSATGGQIYAVVYSRTEDSRDYCLCTNANDQQLTTGVACYTSCAAGVTPGKCSAPGKANVYSIGPAGVQVRACFYFVVEVCNVKLYFVYKCERENKNSLLGGWWAGVVRVRDGGWRRLSRGNENDSQVLDFVRDALMLH
jgi:hypothetical protein